MSPTSSLIRLAISNPLTIPVTSNPSPSSSDPHICPVHSAALPTFPSVHCLILGLVPLASWDVSTRSSSSVKVILLMSLSFVSVDALHVHQWTAKPIAAVCHRHFASSDERFRRAMGLRGSAEIYHRELGLAKPTASCSYLVRTILLTMAFQ